MVFAMFAMVLLTMVVGLFTLKARVNSVKTGELNVGHFRTMSKSDMPESVVKTSRNFTNLFEVPVLFYVACTTYLALDIHSSLAVVIAWVFVASRCAHSYIHTTYNNVMHRMAVFWLGILCVFVLWVILLLSQI